MDSNDIISSNDKNSFVFNAVIITAIAIGSIVVLAIGTIALLMLKRRKKKDKVMQV